MDLCEVRKYAGAWTTPQTLGVIGAYGNGANGLSLRSAAGDRILVFNGWADGGLLLSWRGGAWTSAQVGYTSLRPPCLGLDTSGKAYILQNLDFNSGNEQSQYVLYREP